VEEQQEGQGATMKTLAEICGYRLYLDDRNYTIAKLGFYPETKKDGSVHPKAGQESLTDHMYYGRIDHAVQQLSEITANETCVDLSNWLQCFRSASMAIIEQVKENRT
jgi:hypothetical protein